MTALQRTDFPNPKHLWLLLYKDMFVDSEGWGKGLAGYQLVTHYGLLPTMDDVTIERGKKYHIERELLLAVTLDEVTAPTVYFEGEFRPTVTTLEKIRSWQ